MYREGLRLVSVQTDMTPCAWNKELLERGATGTCSNERFACLYIHIYIKRVRSRNKLCDKFISIRLILTSQMVLLLIRVIIRKYIKLVIQLLFHITC